MNLETARLIQRQLLRIRNSYGMLLVADRSFAGLDLPWKTTPR